MNKYEQNKKRASLSTNPNRYCLDFKIFPQPSSHDQFQKDIETYSSFSKQQIRKILPQLIEIKKFKQLLCNTLQLQYLYHPIIDILQEQYDWTGQKIKLSQIFQILIEGKFFRKLSKQNHSSFQCTNKSTSSNVLCIMASILILASGRLNFTQIQKCLKVFQFEQKLSGTNSFGINCESQRILKILKKLNRKLKPLEFKQWIQDFKKKNNNEKIENFHFLYLVSLSQNKQDQNSFMFFNLNSNKEKKIKIEDTKEQQDQYVGQIEKKEPNQNQKYRIKSLSFKDKTSNLPSIQAFKQIRMHIDQTQGRLKQKKKSLSLLSRIKTKYQPTQDQQIFKQIKCAQNLNCLQIDLLKIPMNERKIISERKKRSRSSLDNFGSRLSTNGQSRKSVTNKQNRLLSSQLLKERLEYKLLKRFPNKKTKKLTLNRQEQKISVNFANVYNYHERKIQGQQKHIQRLKLA